MSGALLAFSAVVLAAAPVPGADDLDRRIRRLVAAGILALSILDGAVRLWSLS